MHIYIYTIIIQVIFYHYTIIILLWYYYDTIIILLLNSYFYYYYTIIILLLYYYYTIIILLFYYYFTTIIHWYILLLYYSIAIFNGSPNDSCFCHLTQRWIFGTLSHSWFSNVSDNVHPWICFQPIRYEFYWFLLFYIYIYI